jgi:hypothetical protein
MNHAVLHGFNYSPPEAGFPGWVRYGAYFSEQNTWWPYFPKWVEYNSRLSYLFQQSTPVKQVAILAPEGDLWAERGLIRAPFHLTPWYCNHLWESFSQAGSSCDYIGESIIRDASISKGMLNYGPMSYQLIILCGIRSLHPETALSLLEFVRQGGKVVITDIIPNRSLTLKEAGNGDETVKNSFSEMLDYKKIKQKAKTTKELAFRRQAYFDYLKHGGFPEMLQIGETQKRGYLRTLFQSIIFKDIVKRFNVKYIKALSDISNILLNNISREISYTKIAKTLGIKSVHTAQNYVSYLEQAYLFLSIPRFSYKSIARAGNRKTYTIDPAFVSFLPEITGTNEGYLLENIVFLELCRRQAEHNFDIYYYKNNYEIDFVISQSGKIQELIQVSLMLENEKTRKREISALLKGANELHCNNLKIITQDEDVTILASDKKIEIVSIINWLCEC